MSFKQKLLGNFSMDTKKLLENLGSEYPMGLGGCHAQKNNFSCCEYNITIFDNTNENDLVKNIDDKLVKIHHGMLSGAGLDALIQYDNMQIIFDEKWELNTVLSSIKEKRNQLFDSFTKGCLVDATICTTKARDGIQNGDPFTSSWVKCAAYFIADAIVAHNLKHPSPAHMLEDIRRFEKNKFNENFTVVNECIGIERATSSLLLRMSKSTIGFSDIVETNNHSKIIQKKYEYFIENSLFSDCYFYLGYINKNNLVKIKQSLHRRPELIHVLKVAFDVESDMAKIEAQAGALHNAANQMLTVLNA